MELNDYNNGFDHCKSEMAALLAPDPNNFIMDLMNFPKGVVSSNTHVGVGPDADPTLPPDLHFHNAHLFPVTTDDHNSHNHHNHHHHHHHSNEPRKSPTYLPLNSSDFLMPVTATKTYNTSSGSVETVEDGSVKVVQELLMNGSSVALDDGSIDDDCDISRFDSRKVLPHKKRISRKLKINHHDTDLQLNVPLEEHKLPHVEQLVGVGSVVQQFRCELCGHVTCSQLDFFAHLKQHYEPSTPDTILQAMKTSLDALGPEKSEAAADLCTIDKKTDGLHQVFQDVHFPFENFPPPDEVVSDERQVDLALPQHVDRVDMKVVYSNTLVEDGTSAAMQQHSHSHTHTQQQTQQQPPQNLVPEEFSDTEDMLEGKVLIEDTCDAMDLMTPTSNGVRPHWFNNNCFNGIDLKTKPFCDVLFSSQFTPMLNADPQDAVPADNMMVTKDLVDSPPPQLMQHATDLRLQFPSDDETALRTHDAPPPPPPPLHQAPPPPAQSLSNNMDLIQPQHIKIEATPDIPTFHSEDTLVANEVEVEVEEEDDYDYDDDGRQSEEYNTQTIDINNERFLITNYSPKNGDLDLTNQNENDDDENENAVDDTGKRKRYLCNKCQRVFNSCNALKYHMRTHSGLRPHQCDICGKSFFAHGALKAHTRTHTGDKPFECEHCDRKFRQWGDLKYHIVSIHSSEKNHQCEYCGKSFSRKYSLVVHLRIHTSERNYKCEFCTKTFRASTYLQNHRKIHTGEKNHECDVCSKRFRVSGDLRRHQRIHERAQKSKKDTLEEKTTTGVKISVASTPTT